MIKYLLLKDLAVWAHENDSYGEHSSTPQVAVESPFLLQRTVLQPKPKALVKSGRQPALAPSIWAYEELVSGSIGWNREAAAPSSHPHPHSNISSTPPSTSSPPSFTPSTLHHFSSRSFLFPDPLWASRRPGALLPTSPYVA